MTVFLKKVFRKSFSTHLIFSFNVMNYILLIMSSQNIELELNYKYLLHVLPWNIEEVLKFNSQREFTMVMNFKSRSNNASYIYMVCGDDRKGRKYIC